MKRQIAEIETVLLRNALKECARELESVWHRTSLNPNRYAEHAKKVLEVTR